VFVNITLYNVEQRRKIDEKLCSAAVYGLKYFSLRADAYKNKKLISR